MRPPIPLFCVLFLSGAAGMFADEPLQPTAAPAVAAPAVSVASPEAGAMPAPAATTQELEILVAPLALYPDPLVALILPAATSPSDIVLASRHLKANAADPALDSQTWDDAVKLLARYPTLITWLDENLAWTKRLGEAFASQPAEVMTAIQAVRARARAAGTLVDTPQQTVTVVDRDIRIVPAAADVIYIPSYDPTYLVVGAGTYYRSGPFISFGFGLPVGHWLAYDCDWRYRTVRYVHRPERPRYWHTHHRPSVSVSVSWCAPDRFQHSHWRAWQPSYRSRETPSRRAAPAATVAYTPSHSRSELSQHYTSPQPSREERGYGSNRTRTSETGVVRTSPETSGSSRGFSSRDRSRDGYRPPEGTAPTQPRTSNRSESPAREQVRPRRESDSPAGPRVQAPMIPPVSRSVQAPVIPTVPRSFDQRESATVERSYDQRRDYSTPARSASPPASNRSAAPDRSERRESAPPVRIQD